ncbi:MAG TPA: L-2-hydroxyglutarate oxidase [Planctomycetota bacterium]|nr:L-2-hydroxyglutarate oxidase [Planctomycetota bacterium]
MIAVVGGGIVGLATAYALRDRKPVVFEKERSVGAHQTGHNSGVLHSGIYYKPGSHKARLCVEGARRMKEFSRDHGIPHEICGKVVVATSSSELPRLEELERRARANGVAAERIGPERLREIEPEASGIAALHVPGTGIIDYLAVARKLASFVEVRRGIRVDDVRSLKADLVINCAGLQSDRVARSRTKIVPFRGEYYSLRRASLVKGLIYPVPDPAFPFLGVHFTRMIGGGVEAGPNAVLALSREGYRWGDIRVRDLLETLAYSGFRALARRHWRMGLREVWRSWSRAAFLRSLQRLVPAVTLEDLGPGGSGVRAQALDPDGTMVDDFRIERRQGQIHVLNAPSPAATASLAIGEHIASLVKG